MARVVTAAGQSVGQQGAVAVVPITTSAAWGSPVQQDWLTETMLVRPTRSTIRKPTSAEPADVVGAGGLADAEPHGQVADGQRTRGRRGDCVEQLSRVGSEMVPNHSA